MREITLLTAKCFAFMAMELDELAVRPVDFEKFFEEMQSECLSELEITETLALAAEVNTLIENLNQSTDYDGTDINHDLNRLFKEVHGHFIRLDWDSETVFCFIPSQDNISILTNALEALENGDSDLAYDEYLWDVDYNWCAYDFDEETYNFCSDKVYYNNEGTWGEGLLEAQNENLFTTIKSLETKYGEENADYSQEIADIQNALENQQAIYDTKIKEVDEALIEVNKGLQNILDTYSK